MGSDLATLFDDKNLLATPVRRAAYSDRTAWLMAAMSELAYFKFEGTQSYEELAKELVELSKANDVLARLKDFLEDSAETTDSPIDRLKELLDLAGFELINTYNRAGSQAFLAKRRTEGDDAMLVLAFRGTEKSLADIKADANAVLVSVGRDEKVHKGFYKAFNEIKPDVDADIDKHSGVPLYITGHSLGGALAVVATRFLASDSHGACYTFGGPRAGNSHLADNIKTPIYRVVNAADIVPRLPPAFLPSVLIALIRWIPLIERLAPILLKLRGYVHYGDMRYLTHVDAGGEDKFEGLLLISNPSIPYRLAWLLRRWISTRGKAAVTDHSISLYRRKLKAHAVLRNQNPPPV